MGINDVNAIQNTTGTMTDTRESCIANASFKITIPHSKEKLKMPKKRTVCTTHEADKDILIPMISHNATGLRVSSLIKNASSRAINIPQNASRTADTHNEIGTENCKIKEKVTSVTNRRTAEESETKSDYKTSKVYDSKLTYPRPTTCSLMEEPSNNLIITILNETTATGEWRMHVLGELAVHIPYERNRLERNIERLEKGMEYLFLQDVRNIKITEVDETLITTFKLKGNYTTGFVTGKCQYTYELAAYAPIGLDILEIEIPENKTLLGINPGPNEIEGNKLVYHNYNWIYPIHVHYDKKGVYKTSAATIGEVWERHTPSVISIDTFGTNNHSRFCIPGNWAGWGSDPVPGTAYNASRVAEMYEPRLYNRADQCPDAIYYRVVEGYDPYAKFDAYLIQYFGYWRCQDPLDPFTSHEHDYEPIFIWVRNIGDRPYRVAYDRWRLDALHMHEIHRTHLWIDPLFEGKQPMPSHVYAQHKAYYMTFG